MKLVYSFNINQDSRLEEMFKISKDLYNQALWEIRTTLERDKKWLFYYDLVPIMMTKENLEGEINYKKLKAQVSQQVLMLLDKNVKSYIKSIKDYSKNKSKYKGVPKLPSYKKDKNLISYSNQSSRIKEGYIILGKDLKISIPQWNKYKDLLSTYTQIRILPKKGYIKVEVVYEKEIENKDLDYNQYGSIDLGISNLVTLISNQGARILSGNQIKSINQYFNKELSRLKSIKDKQNLKTTKRIRELYEKRENTIKDLFHKVSRWIVNFLIESKIGNLVIGYNKNWKDSISLGTKFNQTFIGIPYLRLLDYLDYKCKMVGIKLIKTEESYTSKCDGLAREEIKKHEVYLGKRIKRGLFQSSTGSLLSADVNGALNILRKVLDDSYVSGIINSGLLFNPIRIRDLRSLCFLLKNQNNF